MKKLFVSLIICLLTYSSYCQYTPETRGNSVNDFKNSIYLEIGGNALLYSINYERLFLLGEYAGFATRIGFGSFGEYIVIPLEISGIFGKKHCFELGVGRTFISGGLGYVFRVGYRYRGDSDSGFLFRIALLILPPGFIFPWGGISVGYSF